MPTKIRLMRIGAKKRPFYRIVAVDERKKRTGSYVELLGTYNPLTEPKEIKLKQDRIDWWTQRGAVLSDGYLRMTKQAPQKPPRAPKRDKTAKTEAKEQPKKDETVSAEPVAAEESTLQAEEQPTEVALETAVETPAAEVTESETEPKSEVTEAVEIAPEAAAEATEEEKSTEKA